ncbi:MAG: glycosyltransferase family 4 protein [Arenicellales bacterium]
MSWNRVVLVISSLDVGGAERVLATMANHWAEHGRDVRILSLASPDDAPFYPLDSRIQYAGLGLLGSSADTGEAVRRNLNRVSVIRKTVKAAAPDLIISFMTECNVLVLLATRGLGLPVVVTEHTDPAKCPVARIWSLARRISYKWARLIVVLNRPALEFFAARFNAVVIPNPVPRCDEASAGGARAEREEVILAVGRLGPEKGYDILFRAVAALGEAAGGWRLVILGQGPERDRLESLARHLEIESRVSMPGVVKHPQSYFRTAGIFVLSSRFEGFPMGLCEAMACGMPVVASEYSAGVYDLIEPGVNGLVVPAQDSGALAGALGTLVGDPALRRNLGSRATDIAERFGVARVMGLWEETIGACGL